MSASNWLIKRIPTTSKTRDTDDRVRILANCLSEYRIGNTLQPIPNSIQLSHYLQQTAYGFCEQLTTWRELKTDRGYCWARGLTFIPYKWISNNSDDNVGSEFITCKKNPIQRQEKSMSVPSSIPNTEEKPYQHNEFINKGPKKLGVIRHGSSCMTNRYLLV
jgi:hypothetical protein